jgi:chromosomal replication initiator protein
VRIASVIQLVCAKLAVSDADLRGRSRQEKLVLARTLTAYLSKRLTTMSYPEIARAMGRPNHSTIITACQRMARQIENGATVALSLSGPHEPLGALCDRLSEQLLAEARAMG